MVQRNLSLLLLYSTPIIQLLIGLCIGVACSIILAPFMENSKCDISKVKTGSFDVVENNHKVLAYPREGGFADDTVKEEGEIQSDLKWINDDFEPIIKEIPPRQKASTVDSARRPRYISTELGIREKLFVAVLTHKDTLDTFAVAVNKTVSHYVTKTVFFMNTRKATLPGGMSLVVFNEEKPRSTGLQMLGFIGKQYAKNYDWFLLLEDTTYVRAKKLYDLVSNTSIADGVVVGHPVQDTDPMETSSYCDLGAGVLLSQSMMTQVARRLDWCQENLYDRQDAVVVGKCIRHTTDKTCSTHLNAENLKFVVEPSYSFQESPDGNTSALQGALTVSKVADDATVYKLHRYFCERDLLETNEQLRKTQEMLEKIAAHTPDVNSSRSWPLGVDPPTRPKSRFDVLRWDYFTDSHIYLNGELSNSKELKGADKEDVMDVIKVSVEGLTQKYPGQYTYRRMVNGYRRFDAARGMDYILDLLLYDRVQHSETTKRVRLMRPLGHVELVPMPYVTENSRVNLILPVTAQIRDSVVNFLDSYAHTCLESGDNTYLFVVFIYTGEADQVGDNDKYSVLKSMISFYENKYQNGARIAWTVLQNQKPTVYSILDTISRKFSAESLFLLCTVGMELSIDFLNRVRMNTIANWQVYFPIGFWQYKPNLVHEEKPYPTTIDIDQKVGHFDAAAYSHAGFYNSDYQYARKQMISTSASKDMDLFDMFLKYHNLHVFRAVEPALKLRYQEVTCDPTQPTSAYHRCLSSRGRGLASQAQLAMLIFEHQQKLDQLQMNVMHQQRGPNVGQMKPDMLR